MIFWQRQGVFIARQQMVLWTGQCVVLLQAIVIFLKKELRHSPYVQVDETPVRYLDPQTPGRCAQGYLWTGLVPGRCMVYEWHPSRAAACLDSLLGNDFKGKLQCDGYSAYPAFARDKSGVELFGCWAHARRGFWEAREQAPGVGGWILNQIGILYGWEEQLRQSRAGPARRQALRASHSRMVVARLKGALEKLQPRYLPRPAGPGDPLYPEPVAGAGAVPGARRSGDRQQPGGKCDSAQRGRQKNWLFFGSEEAGTRNAVVMTLVQNCRMHGVNPYEYFKDVPERLPQMTNQDNMDLLTPLNWKKSREQARLKAA